MTMPFEPRLFRIVYHSHCTLVGSQELVDAEIERILDGSRAANARAGLTGALMFTSSFFFQVLEGQSDRLEETFERICRDARHTEIQLIEFNALEDREFADWSMTRVDADPQVEALFAQLQGKETTYGTLAEVAGKAVAFMSMSTRTAPQAIQVQHPS